MLEQLVSIGMSLITFGILTVLGVAIMVIVQGSTVSTVTSTGGNITFLNASVINVNNLITILLNMAPILVVATVGGAALVAFLAFLGGRVQR